MARTISPIFGSDGKVIGSTKTVREITAFKALETRIEERTHERDLA